MAPFLGAAAIEYRVVRFRPTPEVIDNFFMQLKFPLKQMYSAKRGIITWGDKPTNNLAEYLNDSTLIRACSRILASLLMPTIILFSCAARFQDTSEVGSRLIFLFFALIEIITILGFSQLGKSMVKTRS
jgi:hypothetical protein